jgi:O-antigen ligase
MRTAWPERGIEAGALFLLVFTPLAYGTVDRWAEAVAELVILAMALIFILGKAYRDWEVRFELPVGWLPAALFLGLITLQAIVPMSVDPHATRREALRLLAVAAFFLICWNTYRTRAQVWRAVWTMIGMGTLLAILGIVQRVTWNGHLYWVGPESPTSTVFGPFINRAHFAGLMVIVVPMALALMQSRARRLPPSRRWRTTWRDRLRDWSAGESSAANLVPFLVLVMGGAALVSGSRGGMLALLAALLAMVVGSVASGRSWIGRAVRVGLATVLIMLAGAWIGWDVLYGTVERLADELGRPTESPRLLIWADAMTLWLRAPVLGTGLGTFGVAFPSVRTTEAPVVYTHAESDWVQLVTDTGVLGLAFGLAALVSVALVLVQRLRQAQGRSARLFALAGLVVLFGTAIQGVGNYNLHIMSGLIYVALAVVLAASGHTAPPSPATATTRRDALAVTAAID